MFFRILGDLLVEGVDGIVPISSRRLQVVLTMLLLEPNRTISIHRLVDAVWGEAPPASARGQIQICISQLRRRFAAAGLPEVIATSKSGYRCHVSAAGLDLLTFEDRLRKARCAARDGRLVEAEAAFAMADTLWRGPGVTAAGSDLVANIALPLVNERMSAIEELVDVQLQLNMLSGLAERLAALSAQYPLRERLRSHLMVALYRSGRQAEALEAYRVGRRIMVDELGIEPSSELRQLEQAIIVGALETKAPPMSPANGVRSAGRRGNHTEAVAPPQPALPRMLPRDIADFTGREAVVRQICDHLTGPDGGTATVPVVVGISGKPGIGKTTLAVHAAHLLSDRYSDGQLFVCLNGLDDGALTASEALEGFLRALGVQGTQIPDGTEERADLYRTLVSGRRLLVVIDDAGDKDVLRWLLPGDVRCAVIVASRQRLTGLADLIDIEAGVLDAEQSLRMLARTLGPARVYGDLDGALELARLCGGVPIALRIAGARLVARPHWAVSELVERLSAEESRLDELEHHGLGLRSRLSLSYASLSEDARILFRRLGMITAPHFPGWVSAPLLDTSPTAAVEILEQLVDAQLVEVHLIDAPQALGRPAVHYRLHDLFKAYARERLTAEEPSDEGRSALSRFLRCWLYVTAAAHRMEYGSDRRLIHSDVAHYVLPDYVVVDAISDPIRWCDLHRSGLIAAIRQAAAARLTAVCWDLAMTAVTLFESRSYVDDWQATAEIALLEAQRACDRRGVAAMNYSLGALQLLQHQLDVAPIRLEQAQQEFVALEDWHGAALATRELASVDRARGRLSVAAIRYERALAGLLRSGDRIGGAQVLGCMGLIDLELGHRDTTEQLIKRALLLLDGVLARQVRADLHSICGLIRLERKEYQAAADLYQDVLDSVEGYGDQARAAAAMHGLGLTYARSGDTERGLRLLSRALVLATDVGDRFVAAQIRLALAELTVQSGDPGVARALTAAYADFTDLHMPHWPSRALILLGDSYAAAGRPPSARAVWAEAEALLEEGDAAVACRLAKGIEMRRLSLGAG